MREIRSGSVAHILVILLTGDLPFAGREVKLLCQKVRTTAWNKAPVCREDDETILNDRIVRTFCLEYVVKAVFRMD